MKTRLTILTPQEEKTWLLIFDYYKASPYLDLDAAARRAWKDLQKEFPRLLKFQGCAIQTQPAGLLSERFLG